MDEMDGLMTDGSHDLCKKKRTIDREVDIQGRQLSRYVISNQKLFPARTAYGNLNKTKAMKMLRFVFKFSFYNWIALLGKLSTMHVSFFLTHEMYAPTFCTCCS